MTYSFLAELKILTETLWLAGSDSVSLKKSNEISCSRAAFCSWIQLISFLYRRFAQSVFVQILLFISFFHACFCRNSSPYRTWQKQWYHFTWRILYVIGPAEKTAKKALHGSQGFRCSHFRKKVFLSLERHFIGLLYWTGWKLLAIMNSTRAREKWKSTGKQTFWAKKGTPSCKEFWFTFRHVYLVDVHWTWSNSKINSRTSRRLGRTRMHWSAKLERELRSVMYSVRAWKVKLLADWLIWPLLQAKNTKFGHSVDLLIDIIVLSFRFVFSLNLRALMCLNVSNMITECLFFRFRQNSAAASALGDARSSFPSARRDAAAVSSRQPGRGKFRRTHVKNGNRRAILKSWTTRM